MEDLELRKKKLFDGDSSLYEELSGEWKKRLSDYQFLVNKEKPKTQRKLITDVVDKFSEKIKRYSRNEPSDCSRRHELGYLCAKCKMEVHKSCMNNVNQCHGCVSSLTSSHQISQAAALSDSLGALRSSRFPGYGNLQFQEYPWWAERMARDDASIHLALSPEGTFLVRWSDRHEMPVLSLKANGDVKHMRVFRQDETKFFYLSEARYFRSIVELINFYRQSPLSESFTGLDCCLHRPLYDTAVVKFSYKGKGPNHLSLEPGQRVVIMSREGENRGWWKGRIGSRVGYFPKEYVTIENEVLSPW